MAAQSRQKLVTKDAALEQVTFPAYYDASTIASAAHIIDFLML
jgi:hypothetical protein